MRFWSAEPPRTLKDAEKSDTLVTPGSTSMALSGSDSAITGNRLEGRRPDLLHRDPGRLLEAGPGTAAFGFHGHAPQGDGTSFQGDLEEGRPRLDIDLLAVIPEADPGHRKHVGARRQVAEREKAEFAGQGVLHPDRIGGGVDLRQGTGDRPAVVAPDPAGQLRLRLGSRRGGKKGNQEQGERAQPTR